MAFNDASVGFCYAHGAVPTNIKMPLLSSSFWPSKNRSDSELSSVASTSSGWWSRSNTEFSDLAPRWSRSAELASVSDDDSDDESARWIWHTGVDGIDNDEDAKSGDKGDNHVSDEDYEDEDGAPWYSLTAFAARKQKGEKRRVMDMNLSCGCDGMAWIDLKHLDGQTQSWNRIANMNLSST